MRAFGTLLIICILSISAFSQPVPCEEPVEMTPFCNEACIICDVDGFEGRHESNVIGEAPDDFCTFFVHNAQWIAFLAGSEELTVKISVSNCETGLGLEIAIYESLDCENFNLISNCFGGVTGQVSEGNSAEVVVDEPLTIGQYYYIVMDGAGGDNCDWTLEVLNGNTEVTPLTNSGVIEGDFTVCPGITTEYQVTAETGATIFNWTLNGSPVEGDGPNVAIDWTTDGVYELCVMAANACDEAPPSCVFIDVNSIVPQVYNEIICNDQSFMLGDSIILAEAGSYEFNFLSVEGCDSTIFVNLEVFETSQTIVDVNICDGDSLYIGSVPFFETGEYEEVLENYLGCDSIVALDLLVVICEIQGDIDETPVVCFGESSGMLHFQVEDGTPPFTYQWQNLDNTLSGSGMLNDINSIETNTGLPIGTYVITINDNFGNDLILLQDVTQPSVLSNDWMISDFNGFSVACFNSSDGSLEVLPIGGAGPYFYTWNTGDQNAIINNIPAGNYEVTITDSYGCSLVVQNSLTEPTTLAIEAQFTNVNCDGFETGMIEVINVTGGVGPYEYSLNSKPFQDSTSFSGLPAGDYQITVQDLNECMEDTLSQLNAPIIPVVDLGEDLSIFLGDDIDLQVNSNIVLDTVSWSNEPGLDCYICPEPNARPFVSTSYTLTVVSEDDCIDTDSVLVNVIERRRVHAPNVFSPNDDGINDFFNVLAGPEASQVLDFKVFSRWGELVYEQQEFLPNGIGEGWDGTFRGREVNRGVYLWYAQVVFLDGVIKQYEGDIMLLR